MSEPRARPVNPCFGSGPTAKRPGWSLAALEGALVGRSHRAKAPKARLAELLERSHALLGLPGDYRIGLVPGSDTGAFEMAMWNLLGARGVDVLAFESFGYGWQSDIETELELADRRIRRADYGELPPLEHDPARDLVFTWNGTTSGVRVPDGDWLADRARRGHALRCDLGGVRHGACLAKARCRDLLLAEGAGRRGPARHADTVAARGRAPGELAAGLAAAQAPAPDREGKADRGHLPRRDDQHAIHAGGRGRARRPRLGRAHRRPRRADRRAVRPISRWSRAGSRGRPGSTSSLDAARDAAPRPRSA